MTEHPEISHPAKDKRVRAIAYSLWEEEGYPHGRSEAHWVRAQELVEAEAQPVAEVKHAAIADSTDPDWLKRDPGVAETTALQPERGQSLDQLARRIAGIKAA